MPLKKVRSNATKKTKDKVVGSNIAELINDFRNTGKIGTSVPKNDKAAQKQAQAIAISKAEKDSKKKAKKK